MAEYKNSVLKKGKHKVTSPFGMRTIFGKRSMHNGIDLVGEGSTLDYIIAFADGIVKISKNSSSAGEYVELNHGSCYTRYLHMKKGSRTVKVGQAVKKGQILGYMGATGNVTGAHLHFDIKVNNEFVDPAPYLKGEKEFNKADFNVVREWQVSAILDGFEFPKFGADGKWGAECEGVAKKAVCKKRISYKYPYLTKLVQKAIGVKVDGKFGKDTKNAVTLFQKNNGLKQDGCVGVNTWKKILGVK